MVTVYTKLHWPQIPPFPSSPLSFPCSIPAGIRTWLGPTLAGGLAMSALMALFGSLQLASWRSGIRLYTAGAGTRQRLAALFSAPAALSRQAFTGSAAMAGSFPACGRDVC